VVAVRLFTPPRTQFDLPPLDRLQAAQPNDKLEPMVVDDRRWRAWACHFNRPEKGGYSGWLGLPSSVRHLAGFPQDRPDPLQGQIAQGDDMFRQRRSLFFKRCLVRGWIPT